MNLPLIVCAILGASSVLLGAYGAHGLVEKFSFFPKMKTAYENAVDYQMYHSLVPMGFLRIIDRSLFFSYLHLGVRGASLDGSSHSLGRNWLFGFLALACQVRLA
jgi:uncharacterized membrane protein YgdD (TMEM256/DUF423 family)